MSKNMAKMVAVLILPRNGIFSGFFKAFFFHLKTNEVEFKKKRFVDGIMTHVCFVPIF